MSQQKIFCPNCKCILRKNPKHAEGVWQCKKCEGIFMILTTTKPTFINERFIEPDKVFRYSKTTGRPSWMEYKCSICGIDSITTSQLKKQKYICRVCSREKQNLYDERRSNASSMKRALTKELGKICQNCYKKGSVMLHHIIPINQGGITIRENCTLLCIDCHKEEHDGHGVGPTR